MMTDLSFFCQRSFFCRLPRFPGFHSSQSGDFPRHPLWEYHTGRVRVAVTDDRRRRSLVTAEVSLPPSGPSIDGERHAGVVTGETIRRCCSSSSADREDAPGISAVAGRYSQTS